MKRPRRPPDDPWNALARFKNFWILDENRVPKIAADMDEWANFMQRDFEERSRVGNTETATMWVSTVFLGVDHNYRNDGPPILFETMVFSREKYPREFRGKIGWSREDFHTYRYATWDDALTGHNTTVRRIEKLEADALAGIKSGKTPATKGVVRDKGKDRQ